MFCVFCGNFTKVMNSRSPQRLNTVWRRRQCLECKRVFTSTERVDLEKSWAVVDPNDIEKDFHRYKLFLSIYNTLQHTSDPLNAAIGISDTVIAKLFKAGITQEGKVVITTTAIATAAHNALKRFDKAAATLYKASHT